MRNTLLVLTLIAALIAAPVHAQDYTHQPALRTIIDASDCDTVQLPHYAPHHWYDIFIPSFLRGAPQPRPCPPDVYGGTIAIDGVDYTIAPITRDQFSGFDGTSTHDSPLDYSLDQTLTYTDALALAGETSLGDAVYKELVASYAIEGSDLMAYAAGLSQEGLESPADLVDVHNANRGTVLNEWIESGKMTEIQLAGSTPLRPQPFISNEAESLHFICPHLGHLPTYTVKLLAAIILMDDTMGPAKQVVWIRVQHSPEIIAACPFVRIFQWIEGPAFFELMGSLVHSLEAETTVREVVWRQPIMLQPIGGGEIIEGVATFIASPHGQALIVTVVIVTAAAVFIGPQAFVFILVP